MAKHRGEFNVVSRRREEFHHVYLSTACLHEQHESDARKAEALHAYCASERGLCGAKTPGECKFCHAPCGCPEHEWPERPAGRGR